MKFENRRRTKRFRLRYPLCRTQPALVGFCVIDDISLTGMRLLSQELPPIGLEIELWLDGDPGRRRAFCRVIRRTQREKRGFSVEFLGPDPGFLKAALERK